MLLAGQLDVLAPLLALTEARAAAARALQRAHRARVLRCGRLDAQLAAALVLQNAARCQAGASAAHAKVGPELLLRPALSAEAEGAPLPAFGSHASGSAAGGGGQGVAAWPKPHIFNEHD